MEREFELHEVVFLKTRDAVIDDEPVARVNAAPGMGDETLVELSKSILRRAE